MDKLHLGVRRSGFCIQLDIFRIYVVPYICWNDIRKVICHVYRKERHNQAA